MKKIFILLCTCICFACTEKQSPFQGSSEAYMYVNDNTETVRMIGRVRDIPWLFEVQDNPRFTRVQNDSMVRHIGDTLYFSQPEQFLGCRGFYCTYKTVHVSGTFNKKTGRVEVVHYKEKTYNKIAWNMIFCVTMIIGTPIALGLVAARM